MSIIISCLLAQASVGPYLAPRSDASELSEVQALELDGEPPSAEIETEPRGKDPPPGTVASSQPYLEGDLSYTQEEWRARRAYLTAISIGHAYPWQAYTIEVASVWRKDLSFGLIAGGGRYAESGIIAEQAYDVRIQSQSLGVAARWYSSRFDSLAARFSLSHTSWNGQVDPSGADSEFTEYVASRLSTSFQARGLVLGLALGLAHVSAGGVFIEWIPLGLSYSLLLQSDLTRATSEGERAVRHSVARPLVYGFNNLTIGLMF